MFDLDRFLTTTPISVNATNIRFTDNRSGKVYSRVIYRPGIRIDFARLAKEMERYGYHLDWVDDEPGDVPGRMNWSDVFGKFFQQEEA